jgi:hypothetical protein
VNHLAGSTVTPYTRQPGPMSPGDLPPPIAGAALDHVAVAVERWADAWPRYVGQLGGRWSSGGLDVGFGPAQLAFANEARLELLQPWRTQDNPFLRRFLDSNGPGPHHMTFKVDDIGAALKAVTAKGFNPVGVNLSEPIWKEAFLHPRQAGGIVVQLAQSENHWTSPPPVGFPAHPADPAASLVRVVHAVADMERGLMLFHGLLGGVLGPAGVSSDGSWTYTEMSWQGALRIRLIAPVRGFEGPLRHWLGDRPGRLRHLAFAHASSGRTLRGRDSSVPAEPGLLDGEAGHIIEPEENLGTRLVLLDSDSTP